MWLHYFKTAWRNIRRNRATTLINLFGLSVALVAFIFIALWVQNELSFDSYNKDAKDIYLMKMSFFKDNEPGPITVLPLADVLKKNPDVEYVARMVNSQWTLNVNGNLSEEKTTAVVDSDWFKIFDYTIVAGDINSFNRNPRSLIFTQSKAKQLFGNKNPIGQIVKLDTTLYQVRAVITDNPINSSFQFDMLMPMSARLSGKGQMDRDNNWGNASYHTFIKVYPKTNIASFIKNGTTVVRQTSKEADASIAVQPLRELHFDTKSFDLVFRRGSRTAVFIFSALAFLLLITASINYVNLTIAKANARTKEISIRKIIGGTRTQLFLQFLTESFLICFLALCISLFIMWLALPAFNRISETEFRLSFTSSLLWCVLLGTLFFTTFLNGVFPALTMAFFKPLNYLQGYTILKFKNVLFRKGLVVFQFVIGVVFIVGTIVIFLQMHLAQTSAAQYNRSQVVSFDLPSIIWKKMDYDGQKINRFCQVIKNELEKNNSIQSIALASTSIEGKEMNSTGVKGYYWQGIDTTLDFRVARLYVTPEAQSIFNFKLKEGRWFNNDNSDEKNYVLNETAVKEMGLREPVIGQEFAKIGDDTGRIIGVIKDYNFSSLYNEIGAMAIGNNDVDYRSTFFVKIAAGKIPEAMKTIESTWKKFVPDAPLEYQFMNQAFDNLYKDDLKISKLVLLFSCISIIISALGLFGLAAFVAEQRTKEIGIRKVFGASVRSITVLLSKDFIKLVIIGIIIAMPVAWWAAHKWLNNFAYKIRLSWWIFLSAGALVLLIAFLTISSQTIKAAKANPVKSLKTE